MTSNVPPYFYPMDAAIKPYGYGNNSGWILPNVKITPIRVALARVLAHRFMIAFGDLPSAPLRRIPTPQNAFAKGSLIHTSRSRK